MDNVKACPNCGNQISSSASFCPYCGHKVEPTPPSESLCPNCGSKLDPGVKFCSNCGTRVSGEEPKSAPEEPKQTAAAPEEPEKTVAAPEEPEQTTAAPEEPKQTAAAPEEPEQNNGASEQSEKKAYAYGQSGQSGQPQNQQNQQNQSNYGSQQQFADQGEPRYIGFGEAIKLFFKNYANFTGRASRSEFWWSVLLVAILSGIFSLIPVVGIVLRILIWIPSLSITIRRMHDINKMWTWILMGLIPFVGWIIMLVFCVRKSVGDNKWGPVYRDGE